MRLLIRVDGSLPPRRSGATSIWRRDEEVRCLIALRRAALQALGGRPSLARRISFGLRVHLGTANARHNGDLDAFVAGVCDGLGAVSPNTPWHGHHLWLLPENDDVRPDRAIAIDDKSEILHIVAEKIPADAPAPRYEVELAEHGAPPATQRADAGLRRG